MVIATRTNPRADVHVVRKLTAGPVADHIRFEKYREFSPLVTRYDAGIAALPFDDDDFDVVTCMEVPLVMSVQAAATPRRPVTDLDQAQRRIAELEQEVERLCNRKALRATNWLGATVRRALPWR